MGPSGGDVARWAEVDAELERPLIRSWMIISIGVLLCLFKVGAN